MYLIIFEGKYGVIYADDSSFHGYCIIKFSSYPYTLQLYLMIDGQVIYSGEMVCEENYFFPININSCYYVLQKIKSIKTIIFLRTIINGNVNVICYDSKDFLPTCLRSILQNDYNTLSPLYLPMKEHYNIMYKKNRIESIEFVRSVSIGMQDTTYDYND